jgi:hypothetical protein
MNKYNFLKLVVVTLMCAQTNLFAPKGGGSFIGGRDACERAGANATVCLGSQDCSRDSSWGCYVSGDPRSGHGDSGGAGSAHGSSGNGGFSHDGLCAVSVSGSALHLAHEEIEAQALSERYVTSNGKVCTKAQVIAAAKELAGVVVDALKDKEPSLILKGLIAPFFGEKLVDLDCAFAKKAVIEKAAEEIKREIAARKQTVSAAKRIHPYVFGTDLGQVPGWALDNAINQFGSRDALRRYLETQRGMCLDQNVRHVCYAFGGQTLEYRTARAAQEDAIPLAVHQARLREADRQLAVARAQGLA